MLDLGLIQLAGFWDVLWDDPRSVRLCCSPELKLLRTEQLGHAASAVAVTSQLGHAMAALCKSHQATLQLSHGSLHAGPLGSAHHGTAHSLTRFCVPASSP